MARSSQSDAPKRTTLSCSVCGDVAACKHYGINACNGCKGFFRRSILRNRVYKCRRDGRCEVAKERRNSCRACRLNRCIDAGMNPRAVQNEYDTIGGTKNNSVESSGKASLSSTPKDGLPVSLAQNSKLIEAAIQTEVDESFFPNDLLSALLVINERILSNTCSFETDLKVEAYGDDEDITFAVAFAHPTIVCPRTKLNFSPETIANVEETMDHYRRCLVLYFDWIKSLDNFVSLSPLDQINLAKERFAPSTWWLHAFQSMKANCDGCCFTNGTYFPRQRDLQSAPDASDCIGYFVDRLVKPMKELAVDEAEFCLLRAICLFTEDSNFISEEGQAHVRKSREKYIAALFHYESKRNDRCSTAEAAGRLAELLLIMSVLSKLTLMTNDSVKFNDLFSHVNWPKIALELHYERPPPSVSQNCSEDKNNST